MPSKKAVELAYTPNRTEALKHAEALVLLEKDDRGHFPIVAFVSAEFNQHDFFGGAPTVIEKSYFFITQGQQRHWLKFARTRTRTSYRFYPTFEYMLNASDLISILEALKEHIHEYVTDVWADEKKIARCLQRLMHFRKEWQVSGKLQLIAVLNSRQVSEQVHSLRKCTS